MKTDNPDSVLLLFFCCNSAALNYCTRHHMAFIVHLRKDVGFDLEPSWQQRSNNVTQSLFMPFKHKGDYKIIKSAWFFFSPRSARGWKGDWSLCRIVPSAATLRSVCEVRGRTGSSVTLTVTGQWVKMGCCLPGASNPGITRNQAVWEGKATLFFFFFSGSQR